MKVANCIFCDTIQLKVAIPDYKYIMEVARFDSVWDYKCMRNQLGVAVFIMGLINKNLSVDLTAIVLGLCNWTRSLIWHIDLLKSHGNFSQ
jgi:hypothetical protein